MSRALQAAKALPCDRGALTSRSSVQRPCKRSRSLSALDVYKKTRPRPLVEDPGCYPTRAPETCGAQWELALSGGCLRAAASNGRAVSFAYTWNRWNTAKGKVATSVSGMLRGCLCCCEWGRQRASAPCSRVCTSAVFHKRVEVRRWVWTVAALGGGSFSSNAALGYGTAKLLCVCYVVTAPAPTYIALHSSGWARQQDDDMGFWRQT